jgi:glycosyltransferase involved in cell wall biosynthesis
MNPPITALILAFNEEQHIARVIKSLQGVVERICIVDSFSSDRTVEISRNLGAEVKQNPWKNYATQFQYGLDNFDITSDWTMRIDCDEYLEPGLQKGLKDWFDAPKAEVNALYLRRKMVFLNRPITHGFFYPAMMLRIWRTGLGRIEARWMDEHIVVEEIQSEEIHSGDLVDHNLNDLNWWVAKHNGYATREVYDMVEILEREAVLKDNGMEKMTGQAARKRFLKEQVYSRLPSTLRASMYFAYRYILGRGFLDGKAGFYFHFLQAYWYRTLVEAKLYELQLRANDAGKRPYEILVEEGIFPFREENM